MRQWSPARRQRRFFLATKRLGTLGLGEIHMSTTTTRREVLKAGIGAVAAAAIGGESNLDATEPHSNKKEWPVRPTFQRYRFGVNYAPSREWFFFWNSFDVASVARDLDDIVALGMDHFRIFLVWPYFQPNRKWVSPAHLTRLDRLLALAAERKLDVQLSLFNGWLTWKAVPMYDDGNFYRSARMLEAQELYVKKVAAVARQHDNFLGFDLGNEMACVWSTGKDTAAGDAWCERILTLAESLCPKQFHVNGTWGQWYFPDTFSPRFMATRPGIPILHSYPVYSGAVKHGGFFDPPCLQLIAAEAALVRAYAGNASRPVWCQEYGMTNGWLPDQRVGDFLERITLAGIQGGVNWFTAWCSHDIDRRLEFASHEYDFGLITSDHKIKERGRRFKAIADQYRGKPVVKVAKPLPPPPASQAETWKWLLAWMEFDPKQAKR
jgi:hypothetical protein